MHMINRLMRYIRVYRADFAFGLLDRTYNGDGFRYAGFLIYAFYSNFVRAEECRPLYQGLITSVGV